MDLSFPQGWVYTLLCQDRKIYVGWTAHDNLARRIAKHFCGNGSKWTMRHRPLSVLAVIEGGEIFRVCHHSSLNGQVWN